MTTIEAISQDVQALREFVSHLADRHIDRHEMAKRLGVSPATVDRRAKAGELPLQIFGKFLLSSVVAFELKNKVNRERAPESIPNSEDGQHLYRYFGPDGELLYVGVSHSAIHRQLQHKSKSPWFKKISRMDVAVYKSRADALIAEKMAIQKEKPLHNIVHAPRKSNA